MEWVPDSMWLSYLQVGVDAAELDYDLAISAHENTLPSLDRAGIAAPEAVEIAPPDGGTPLWPLGVGVVSGMVAVVAVLLGRGRRDERPPVTGASA